MQQHRSQLDSAGRGLEDQFCVQAGEAGELRLQKTIKRTIVKKQGMMRWDRKKNAYIDPHAGEVVGSSSFCVEEGCDNVSWSEPVDMWARRRGRLVHMPTGSVLI
jgi:hypothetical protein